MNETGAPITLLVVDDHPIVREGLVAVLAAEPDFLVVGQARSGEEAVERHRELRPDLTLMDLRLPGISGIDAIRIIRGEAPEARIVVLSTYDGDEHIRQALEAGAASYLLKDMRGTELVGAIRTVALGQRRLPREVSTRLSESGPRAELTPREQQVLTLMAEGLSNRAIGERLGLAEATVKSYVNHILAKIEAEDRTGAVLIAIKRGLVTVR